MVTFPFSYLKSIKILKMGSLILFSVVTAWLGDWIHSVQQRSALISVKSVTISLENYISLYNTDGYLRHIWIRLRNTEQNNYCFVNWIYIFCSWHFSKMPDPWSISLPNLISCELLFDALCVVVISRVERWDRLIIILISEKLLDVVQNYFWVFQLSNKSTGFPPDPLLW